VIKSSNKPKYLRLIFFISAGRKANCDLRKPIFSYNFLLHLARIWHEIESCVSHNLEIDCFLRDFEDNSPEVIYQVVGVKPCKK
jgi:hypothetical protein